MSENRDNFIKSLDDSQCGITYKMESVYSMLKDKDPVLYLKLVGRWLLIHLLLIEPWVPCVQCTCMLEPGLCSCPHRKSRTSSRSTSHSAG